jgi:hypothetical protein
MGKIKYYLLSLAFMALFVVGNSAIAADWFSNGDPVVVVKRTPVKSHGDTVAMLDEGTNFRVIDVNGSFVGIAKLFDGEKVKGWVLQKDVMKLAKETKAIYATSDTLVSGQGQHVGLSSSIPVTIKFESDSPVDLFIVSESNQSAYSSILKNGGKGEMNAHIAKQNFQRGTFTWAPPNEKKHVLIVDNTKFPVGGAKSGRTINYKVAYCVDDPLPDDPIKGKGILFGRATLDFDDYNGKNGRHKKSFNVIIDVVRHKSSMDVEGDVVRTLEAPIDSEGYFFLENLSMNYLYVLKKFDDGDMKAPIPISIGFTFGIEDEDEESGEEFYRKTVAMKFMSTSSKAGEPSVLDVGHIALRVNSKGKLQARVDAAHVSVKNMEDSIQFGFASDGPLDRHEWFLDKFPRSGWSKTVKSDRDLVYKERKDSKKEKEEEKRRKEAGEDEEDEDDNLVPEVEIDPDERLRPVIDPEA